MLNAAVTRPNHRVKNLAVGGVRALAFLRTRRGTVRVKTWTVWVVLPGNGLHSEERPPRESIKTITMMVAGLGQALGPGSTRLPS